MILRIDDYKTISDVQERFSECFPYLKIEFFYDLHRCLQGPFTKNETAQTNWVHTNTNSSASTGNLIDPSTKIGYIRRRHDPGIMEIKSWYKASRVEKEFKERFGLHVCIFRLENENWMLTESDDDLTLKDHMENARRTTASLCSNKNNAEEEDLL